MSITPASLIKWAESIPLDCEENYRASASRAYYAAYHDCQAFHGSLPAFGIGLTSCGVHENLVHRLQHPAPETKEPERTRSKKRGQYLRAIKHLRGRADYDITLEFDECDARNMLAKASEIMRT